MTALYDEILGVLSRHMSSIHARSVLSRATHALGLPSDGFEREHLPGVVERLDRAGRLFLTEKSQASLRSDLERLVKYTPSKPLGNEKIPIRTERDILQARARVRELATALAASRMGAQRLATIVSELARNIVLYTPGGEIELCPNAEPKGVLVRARDHGTGIANLDVILSGQYTSKTGLGMGLLGSKRLCDRFDIRTGSTGTHIVAEVRL